jgi:hypothetical protein
MRAEANSRFVTTGMLNSIALFCPSEVVNDVWVLINFSDFVQNRDIIYSSFPQGFSDVTSGKSYIDFGQNNNKLGHSDQKWSIQFPRLCKTS